MLNPKMQGIANAIKQVIESAYPSNYLRFIFDEKITLKDVINQILFDGCKKAYDEIAPRHSLRSYLKDPDDDSIRMMYQRAVKKIYDYRTTEYEMTKAQSGIELKELLPPTMENVAEKMGGYKFNKFQFWEINNIHDMELVTAIADGKIFNKNFTNANFRDMAAEYDRAIMDIITNEKTNDEDFLFASLELFTLEWKYAFDFYYDIAVEMEKQKVNTIPMLDKKCSLFCGRVALKSILNSIDIRYTGGIVHTDSRMAVMRRKFIPEFVNLSPGLEFDRLEDRYAETLVLVSSIGERFEDWFIQNSCMDDWVSVMSEYNVFDCFEWDKQWPNKRIRYVKDIYRTLNENNKNIEKS